ncbi:MAG: D-alanyl-D-alanine carboxypeptidase [Clostridia bacterium]|nr:D-alanyl-D-alanine carboxypeptidase [Clostridia bacterium]
MKKIRNLRFVCLLLVLLSVFYIALPSASASSFDDGLPDTGMAKNVYLASLDTGLVIMSKDATTRIAPASTVKILTGLIALEHFGENINTTVTVSSSISSHKVGSCMGLMPSDQVSALDLIYATVCGGYNDAAYALAYAISGSPDAFVKLMNEKMRALGAKETLYTNPSGIDDEAMYTTLSDTVKLVKAAINNELYMEISSAIAHKGNILRDGNNISFTANNKNSLISGYYAMGYTNPSASGVIAGMTDSGGYCVATKLDIGKCSYICVVMGASATETTIGSYATVNTLTAHIRQSFSLTKVMDVGDRICQIPTEFALTAQKDKEAGGKLDVKLGEDVYLLLPNNVDLESELSYKYYLYSETLTAPIFAGERVGSIDFYYNGELIYTAPLIVSEDVAANKVLLGIEHLKEVIWSRTALISVILFAAILPLYLHLERKAARRRSQKILKISSSRKL